MDRFNWPTNAAANPSNIIKGCKYRFTVLTARLIRLEYDANGIFEDRATQAVFYRDFPLCDFKYDVRGDEVCLETEHLRLSYKKDLPFSKESLKITFRRFAGQEWYFTKLESSLGGTTCTLDGINGETALENGVCSREGFAVLDDSERLVLTDDGWFDVRNSETDIYFFGYGHDYLDAVGDFYRLTGKPPMLPAYALGNWWSRYHVYTQESYLALMDRFAKEDIPFSVAVVDMDWHITKIPEEYKDKPIFSTGWTGYSWNRELFPNYKQFLKDLKDKNLVTSLNLHPAQGVGSHEDMYPQMARACGIDPESKKRVKLDLLNPCFMENYFDILHHPYEADGVDFWWMDWQQGTNYWWIHDEEHQPNKLEKMDPLWLLNHLHILDIKRNGKRPMFFSRYSGPGSHRYPIGFSGDTVVTWESLAFQPYFTASASNIGYCWWSHDIGGHTNGYRDDELVVRWMQLGVFSPINRLHSTSNLFAGKEPWNLNPHACNVATDWLRLRHRLFPYIYTMNERSHKKLIPLVCPMYYFYSESNEAYEQKNQYFFGSELMVSPITEKNSEKSLLGRAKVWFPEGMWIDFFNGAIYHGDCVKEVYRSLDEMPVFAKAGAIVPMQENDANKLGKSENISLYVFPGADNEFVLYEDSGDGNGFENEEYATTRFSLSWGNNARLLIDVAKGDKRFVPSKRNWNIMLRGFNKDININVTVDGKHTEVQSISYDRPTQTVIVCINNIPTDSKICLDIESEQLIHDNSFAKGRIYNIILHSQMSYATKSRLWNYINGDNHDKPYTMCDEECNKSVLGAVKEQLSLLDGN